MPQVVTILPQSQTVMLPNMIYYTPSSTPINVTLSDEEASHLSRLPNTIVLDGNGFTREAMGAWNASASATGGAGMVLTHTPAAGNYAFVTGFEITTSTVTADVAVVVTVGGVTSPAEYVLQETTTGNAPLVVTFAQPLRGTGTGVAVTLTVPALTGGGTVAVNLTGYESDTAPVLQTGELIGDSTVVLY